MGICNCIALEHNNTGANEVFVNNEQNNCRLNTEIHQAEDEKTHQKGRNKTQDSNKKNCTTVDSSAIKDNPYRKSYEPIKNHTPQNSSMRQDGQNSPKDEKVCGVQESEAIPTEKKDDEEEINKLEIKKVPKREKKNEGNNDVNIVLIGDKEVGKSAFMIKIVDGFFETIYIPTLGCEMKEKRLRCKDKAFKVNFYVTASDEYKDDYSSIFAKADYFLAFYDVGDLSSFKKIKKYLKKDLQSYLRFYDNSKKSNVFLVGNKIDLRRQIDTEMAKKYCNDNNIQLFEISVKSGENVTNLIQTILNEQYECNQ